MTEGDWTLVVVTLVLVAAIVAVAWLTLDAGWAVAVATIALVSATLILGRHTRNLATATQALGEATKQLARIEERRDLRNRLEKAIAAAESVRDIDVNQYVDALERGQVHTGFAQRVLELAKYAALVSDADTRRALTHWRDWIDMHLSKADWSIGGNGGQMRKEYRDLQARLQSEVTAWRDGMVSL